MKAQCCHRYLQLDYPQSIGKQLTDFCQLLASDTGVDSANYSFQFLIICLDTQSLVQLFSFLFFFFAFFSCQDSEAAKPHGSTTFSVVQCLNYIPHFKAVICDYFSVIFAKIVNMIWQKNKIQVSSLWLHPVAVIGFARIYRSRLNTTNQSQGECLRSANHSCAYAAGKPLLPPCSCSACCYLVRYFQTQTVNHLHGDLLPPQVSG